MLKRSILIAATMAAMNTTVRADAGHAKSPGAGTPGSATDVRRTVEIEMTDNRYDHDRIEVREGETVRFVIHNRGQLVHEFNIGTPNMHGAHQAEMTDMMKAGAMSSTRLELGAGHGRGHGHGGMMGHDDPNSVLLGPGDSEEMVWRFDGSATRLEFACNVPGHYQAGMVGRFHRQHL
jgi:uncharacterized cupredoxin-like copper-binding protein